jgi:hypothetical protein
MSDQSRKYIMKKTSESNLREVGPKQVSLYAGLVINHIETEPFICSLYAGVVINHIEI